MNLNILNEDMSDAWYKTDLFNKTITKQNRNLIKNYIEQTFQYKTVTFPSKYFLDRSSIENELFTLEFYEDYLNGAKDRFVKIKPKMKHFNNVLVKYLSDPKWKKMIPMYSIQVDSFDDKNYRFSTIGHTPVRWLEIIKDFYWKDITIEDSVRDGEINPEIIDFIPDAVLTNIINTTPHYYGYFEVTDEKWGTLDCSFTEYTQEIVNTYKNYLSITPVDSSNQRIFKYNGPNPPYKKFAAGGAEGGILFSSKYVLLYSGIQYVFFGSYYTNYTKGENCYTTDHVNPEELYVFYMFLKDNGVSVSDFTLKGGGAQMK